MKLTLTNDLLTVLQMISQKKALLISESQIGLCQDWLEALKQYYNSIPGDIIQRVGLKKSHKCFISIESFTIPREWLSAQANELADFEFGY